MRKVIGLVIVDVSQLYFKADIRGIKAELDKAGLMYFAVNRDCTVCVGDFIRECVGFIYVGPIGVASPFIEEIKRHSGGVKKTVGILQRTKDSCESIVKGFTGLSVNVISDFRSKELVRKLAMAL